MEVKIIKVETVKKADELIRKGPNDGHARTKANAAEMDAFALETPPESFAVIILINIDGPELHGQLYHFSPTGRFDQASR
jgi:hypothetical protein